MVTFAWYCAIILPMLGIDDQVSDEMNTNYIFVIGRI